MVKRVLPNSLSMNYGAKRSTSKARKNVTVWADKTHERSQSKTFAALAKTMTPIKQVQEKIKAVAQRIVREQKRIHGLENKNRSSEEEIRLVGKRACVSRLIVQLQNLQATEQGLSLRDINTFENRQKIENQELVRLNDNKLRIHKKLSEEARRVFENFEGPDD